MCVRARCTSHSPNANASQGAAGALGPVVAFKPVIHVCMDDTQQIRADINTALNTWAIVGASGSGKTDMTCALVQQLRGVMGWDGGYCYLVCPRATYVGNQRLMELFPMRQVRVLAHATPSPPFPSCACHLCTPCRLNDHPDDARRPPTPSPPLSCSVHSWMNAPTSQLRCGG